MEQYMEEYERFFTFLQVNVRTAFEKACGLQWCYDANNNDILALEMVYDLDEVPTDEIEVIPWRTNEQKEFEVYLRIGIALRTFKEVQVELANLLNNVRESIFFYLPRHTREALRFWCIVGTRTHGHIGWLIVKQDDMLHINIAEELEFERYYEMKFLKERQQ